jgi:hypothetical protein
MGFCKDLFHLCGPTSFASVQLEEEESSLPGIQIGPDHLYNVRITLCASSDYRTAVSKTHGNLLIILLYSFPGLGRRHQFHPFSQKLKCGWENI